MAPRTTHLGFTTFAIATVAVLGLFACQDKRLQPDLSMMMNYMPPFGTRLISASQVQFRGQPTEVDQIAIDGTNMAMVGRPFGVAWMQLVDPENPSLTAAASDQITTFSPTGAPWLPTWYGAGAATLYGNITITSGSIGSTVISTANPQLPQVAEVYPPYDPNSTSFIIQPTTDPTQTYIYTALVLDPTNPTRLYGFSRQDHLDTLDLSQGTMQPVSRTGYGSQGQSVCCVLGAAAYQGYMFVAFRDRLLYYNITANGLANPQELLELNAVNVVATPQYLYVQHEPTASITAGQAYPAGIYVFQGGQAIAYFPAGSPTRFAVSQDDTHFYAYYNNPANPALQIYRILWTN